MRLLFKGSLVSISVLCLAWAAVAQNAPSLGGSTSNALIQPRTLTGKERLGRKWMDEQRIDNCNVPIDKRGTKPRPTSCAHVPMG